MLKAFCRQDNGSQRQRNHGLSLEHQKSMLKTQWDLVQILIFKAIRIRGTKSKAKQNPLYVKRGRIRLPLSSFLPMKGSLKEVDSIAEIKRIFHCSKVVGPAHVSSEGTKTSVITARKLWVLYWKEGEHIVIREPLWMEQIPHLPAGVIMGEFLHFTEPLVKSVKLCTKISNRCVVQSEV